MFESIALNNTQTLRRELHPQKNAQQIQKRALGFGSDDSTGKTEENTGRKFSLKNAGSQFWQGLVSPIVNMVKSPTNLAIGAVVGLVIKKLFDVTSNGQGKSPLAPIFVALGMVYGTTQLALGSYSAYKNRKNPAKAEKDFYNIGQGAGALGASVLASPKLLASGKESLEAAQSAKLVIPASAEKNPFTATIACLNPKNLKIFGSESASRMGKKFPELKEFVVKMTKGGLLGGGAATVGADETLKDLSASLAQSNSNANADDIMSYVTRSSEDND